MSQENWKGTYAELDYYISCRKYPQRSRFYHEWIQGGNALGGKTFNEYEASTGQNANDYLKGLVEEIENKATANKEAEALLSGVNTERPLQATKEKLQEQIKVLMGKIDKIDSLTEQFLKDPNHFDLETFLENSDLKNFNAKDLELLAKGEVKVLETDKGVGKYGLGLARLYKTKDGGFALFKVESDEGYDSYDFPIPYQELDMDSLEVEDGIGTDIFPGFYEESVQKDFESSFINDLTADERLTYGALKELQENMDSKAFYDLQNLTSEQKGVCEKIRKAVIKDKLNADIIKSLTDRAVSEATNKGRDTVIEDQYDNQTGLLRTSDLQDKIAERLGWEFSEYGIKDFKLKETGETKYVPAGRDQFNGSVEVYNRQGELVQEDSCGGLIGENYYDVEGVMNSWVKDGYTNTEVIYE